MSRIPAYKPYFLGPLAENEAGLRTELAGVLDAWFRTRRARFPGDPCGLAPAEQAAPQFQAAQARIHEGLAELLAALDAEVPTFAPRFLGHMVSDVTLPALLGHLTLLLHNPNLTSREASKVGTALETQAIAMLAKMVGFDPGRARGHFTSGGTIANLEAVWRARYRLDSRLALAIALGEQSGRPVDVFAAAHQSDAAADRLVSARQLGEPAMRARSAVLGNPFEMAERLGRLSGRPYRGPVILAPGHKHYSWVKAANLFGLGEEAFWSVELDREGRLCPRALAARIEAARSAGRPILMVVSVAGTTELGELDPVDAVADHLDARVREQGLEIWHHVDGAYGGFFCALSPDEPGLAPGRRRALAAIRRADTVTIDPHKLGYAPYACGALLARDEAHDAVSSFAAPYVDRPELGDAAWMRTIEGSRPATGAAATWLTGRTLGFGPDGLGSVLSATLDSCRAIRDALCAAAPQVRPLDPSDTNIFCFSVAEQGESLSAANARTAAIHRRIAESPTFAMSRTVLSTAAYPDLISSHVESYGGRQDCDRLVLVRCVAMNPFWAEPAIRSQLLPQLAAELRSHIDLEAGATAPAIEFG